MSRRTTVPAYRMERDTGQGPGGAWLACEVRTPRDGRLPLYHAEMHHSHDFSWGYDGSGPAQLAYALARHATKSSAIAAAQHQFLKRWLTSRVQLAAWGVTPHYILRLLDDASDALDAPPQPVVIPATAVDLAATVREMSRLDRCQVHGMLVSGDLGPLADLLADLGCREPEADVGRIVCMRGRDGGVYA